MTNANISYLTDKDHRLPDWILRTIAGQMRFTGRDENKLKRKAFGYLRELYEKQGQDEQMDVKSQWRFLILCSEIGMKQMIREYEDRLQANWVGESEQPS